MIHSIYVFLMGNFFLYRTSFNPIEYNLGIDDFVADSSSNLGSKKLQETMAFKHPILTDL